MIEFNKNNKKGTASHKVLENLKDSVNRYDDIKREKIKIASEILGFDFLTNYGVSDNFDFSKLPNSVFKRKRLQSLPMPFSNSEIEKFILCDKKAVNSPYYVSDKGRIIYGTYLYSDEDGKNLVFALSISNDNHDKENKTNFSIKLDMLVKGKEWLQLLRFDSSGAGHPNYITDGNIATNVEEVNFSATPHIHINSEEVQVLLSEIDNCEYTEAKTIEQLKVLRNNSDELYFKKCLELFLSFSNISTKINSKVESNYLYSKTEPLFDREETLKIDKIVDFKAGTLESNIVKE